MKLADTIFEGDFSADKSKCKVAPFLLNLCLVVYYNNVSNLYEVDLRLF